MTYQKCPICEGTGMFTPHTIVNVPLPPCPVCKGKSIIHTDTGLPPAEINNKTWK